MQFQSSGPSRTQNLKLHSYSPPRSRVKEGHNSHLIAYTFGQGTSSPARGGFSRETEDWICVVQILAISKRNLFMQILYVMLLSSFQCYAIHPWAELFVFQYLVRFAFKCLSGGQCLYSVPLLWVCHLNESRSSLKGRHQCPRVYHFALSGGQNTFGNIVTGKIVPSLFKQLICYPLLGCNVHKLKAYCRGFYQVQHVLSPAACTVCTEIKQITGAFGHILSEIPNQD